MEVVFDIDSYNPWSLTEEQEVEPVSNRIKKGTSLLPPTYDSRTIFSVFGSGETNKRVVDMDQIWMDAKKANDATSTGLDEVTPVEEAETRKKKLHNMKNHSKHIRPSPHTKMILHQQIEKHKDSMAAIKRANSHPSLQTAHDLQAAKPSRTLKHSLNNFSTPISYHGFLAAEMRRASSWDTDTSASRPTSGEQSRPQSIAVLKEIYQIR